MRKGQTFTDEQKQRISAGIGSRKGQGSGRKMSEATKEKISLAKQSKKRAMEVSLSASPQFGVSFDSSLVDETITSS